MAILDWKESQRKSFLIKLGLLLVDRYNMLQKSSGKQAVVSYSV